MGLECECVATWNGARSQGKALLETNEVVFRGDYRVYLNVADLKTIAAAKGLLKLKTVDGLLILELGKSAEKWAERIKNPKARIDKFGVKEGMRIAVIGVPDDMLELELRARGVQLFEGSVKYLDMVFAGFDSVLALKGLPRLLGMIKSEGAIWAVYPKAHADIKESDVRGAFRALEMKDVIRDRLENLAHVAARQPPELTQPTPRPASRNPSVT